MLVSSHTDNNSLLHDNNSTEKQNTQYLQTTHTLNADSSYIFKANNITHPKQSNHLYQTTQLHMHKKTELFFTKSTLWN